LPVEPYDEEEIDSTGTIIRRINPIQHVVWDDNRKSHRISTKAFSPSSGKNGGMSVDIESLIINNGCDPKEYVTTPTFTGSVSFFAGDARKLDLVIGYDPISENLFHGEVWGSKRPSRFSNSQKRRLMAISKWYVKLENIFLS